MRALIGSRKTRYNSRDWNCYDTHIQLKIFRSSVILHVKIIISFSSHSNIFHLFGDVTIVGEGLQILTYVWHSWPLSGEGSLSCHTYCDTRHPFIMVTPRTRDTHTYCWSFGSGAVTTSFDDLGVSQLGFEHPTYRLRGEHSNLLRQRRGF